MRLLIDTNIFLEIILEQEKAQAARALLATAEPHEFFLSDFSLHSIGLLLFRRRQHEVFYRFLQDMLFNVGINPASLSAEDMESVINAGRRFQLDFDDAYQYAAADKYNLTIVSLDTDFDRTERGKKTPVEVLQG